MPQINLSTLNGRELRQLLDASRRRGDASLSYQILQEMAARRERPAERGPFMMLRPAERRAGEPERGDPVDVEFGEPAETDDLPPMPRWRAPEREPETAAALAPEPQVAAEAPEAPAPRVEPLTPPPAARRSRRKTSPVRPLTWDAALPAGPAAPTDVEAEHIAEASAPSGESARPLSLIEAEPAISDPAAAETEHEALRMERPAPAAKARGARPPRLRVIIGFALGILVGVALGWWAAGFDRGLLSPASPPAVRTAALEPRPAPAVPPPEPAAAAAPLPSDAVADTPAETAAGTQAPERRTGAAAEVEAAHDADGKAIEPPPPPPPPEPAAAAEPARTAEAAQATPERTRTAAASACTAQPTPADRAICADPQLQRLQGELRRAYAKALDAHQDRALLRQRQLAWADARNTVSDPARLARLYEERIRKLNAAAAAARHER